MLKKINRLSKIKDFTEVKQKGVMYHSPLFSLAILKSDGNKKFGFVISKKISKRAVDRNKIKRLLTESLKSNLVKIGDIKAIFFVKTAILGKKFEEIDKEVCQVIKSVKL